MWACLPKKHTQNPPKKQQKYPNQTKTNKPKQTKIKPNRHENYRLNHIKVNISGNYLRTYTPLYIYCIYIAVYAIVIHANEIWENTLLCALLSLGI